MTQVPSTIVRGTCSCGQRYRVRNARPDVTVRCPRCHRTITITAADLDAASADTRLIPIQAEGDDLLEVIPIDDATLSLAPEGTRPGLTGHAHISHGDSAVACAQWSLARAGALTSEYAHGESPHDGPGERRGFYHDLLAGFWCAGDTHNIKVLLFTSLAWWLVLIPLHLLVLFGDATVRIWGLIVTSPLVLVLLLYVVHFWWSAALTTAAGDDRIPWFQEDWSIWHDALLPLLWLLALSLVCSAIGLPAALALQRSLAGTIPFAVAGWVFWPAALAIALAGRPLRDLLPDRILLLIWRTGAHYAVVCLLLLVNLAAWLGFLYLWQYWLWLPVVGVAVNLYFGYVLFRTIGLLIFYHLRPT